MRKWFFILCLSVVIAVFATINPNSDIKRSIDNLRYAYEIDADSLFTYIDSLKFKAENSDDVVSRSIYYSYLATVLNDYYNQNSFIIDGRTNYNGFTSDITEWSKQTFKDTIQTLSDLSIKEKEALVSANILKYKDILEWGKDSLLRPTMYDILVHRVIDIAYDDTLKVANLYALLIESNKDNVIAREAAKLDLALYRSNYNSNFDYTNFADDYKGTPIFVYAKSIEIEHSNLTPKQKHTICSSILNDSVDNPYICSIQYIKDNIEQKELCLSNSKASDSKLLYPGVDENINLSYKNFTDAEISLFRVKCSALEFNNKGFYRVKDSDLVPLFSDSIKLPFYDDFENHTYSYTLKGLDYGIYVIKVIADGDSTICASDYFYVTKMFVCSKNVGKRVDFYIADRISGKPISGVKVAKNNKNYGGVTYSFAFGKDIYYPPYNSYNYSSYSKEKINRYLSFFTDRGVYRPGQKVMAKGIVYDNGYKVSKIVENTSVKINLIDTKGSIISSKNVVTNEFGSFYLCFDIPLDSKGGRYSLSSQYGEKYFSVEEYKRPTFDLKIDSVRASSISDSVYVSGFASYFRGTALSGADVRYKVYVTPQYFCHWIISQNKSFVTEGATRCGSDGNFSFSFFPDASLSNSSMFYRYTIDVFVTDASSETQMDSYSLVLGKASYAISFPLNGLVDRDKIKDSTPKAFDSAGNSVTIPGEYIIYCADSIVQRGGFVSGKNIDLKKLKSGVYKIELKAMDIDGRKIYSTSSFTLYSITDKKPAEESLLWAIPIKTECKDGEYAEFVLGSSFDSYILMELYSEDSLVSRKVVNVNALNSRQKIKYCKSYSNSVTVNLLTIKNGKSESKSIALKRYEKQNDIKVELHRSKTVYYPGCVDSWKVKVVDSDGVGVNSEVAISVYDLSVDKICSNSWEFSPLKQYYKNAPQWNTRAFGSIYSSAQGKGSSVYPYNFDYPQLSLFGFDIYRSRFYPLGMKMAVMAPSPNADAISNDAMFYSAETAFTGELAESTPYVRSNFAETALFTAQAFASNGLCNVDFKAPDALTSWKIIILAYDKQMRSSILLDTIITNKPLSVNPNIPRFVRQGDSTIISANIDNSSDSGVICVTEWSILDSILGSVAHFCDTINIDASSVTTSKCKLVVPDRASGLNINVKSYAIAFSDSSNIGFLSAYSDAYETNVKAISYKAQVEESMPIYLASKGKYLFDFQSFANNSSSSRVDKKYLISISPDASKPALEAIKYVKEPKFNNSIDLSLAYYANILSSSVFGENNSACATSLLKDLFALQNSDGGFSWFSGGNSSSYTTLFVVKQLQKCGYKGKELSRALDYLASGLKNIEKPDSQVIETLIALGKKGYEYTYYNYLKENWHSYSLVDQSFIAILLNNNDDSAEAKKIINNIRKFTVYKSDRGLYLPNSSTVSNQANFIKAFALVDKNDDELLKMKQYLIVNKRSTAWDNSIATASAVDAIVNYGVSSNCENSHIVVSAGNITIDSDSLSNVEYEFSNDNISKELAKVSIHKSGNAVAIGAVYWEYLDDVDKVTDFQDDRLTIKREFCIEKGGVLTPSDCFNVGDVVTVRIVIKADRDIDFVHINDMRASGFEPLKQTSSYSYFGGAMAFVSSGDNSTDIFFDRVPKGTYVIEYKLKASCAGTFASGFASVKSLYADDFVSHTQSSKIVVK